MFITKLVLHKCTRFYVKGIETLEINPSMKTQIVLGTNGSGKSSLLKIGFTVMPPGKDDFSPGGYKILCCIANGHEYELHTIRAAKGMEHVFICDGEDLNPGKTAAVQRELLKEHFRMTKELHDVLTGQTKFTAMNGLDRRKWITELSSADFDYVIKLHNRIKKAARAANSVIEHQNRRLTQETAKKLSEEEMRVLRNQSSDLRKQLNDLFTLYDGDLAESNWHEHQHIMQDIIAEMTDLAEQGNVMNVRAPVELLSNDREVLPLHLEDLGNRKAGLQQALHEVSEQHALIDRQLHELDELGEIDPEQLTAEIAQLEEWIEELKGGMKTTLVREILPRSTHQLQAVDEVIARLHSIRSEVAGTYSREALQQKQQEYSDLQERYRQGTSRIGEIVYRLEHIANCQAVECPNCHHTFKEGVNPAEEAELKLTLNKGEKFRDTMEGKLTEVKTFLEEGRDVEDAIYQLEMMRNQHPQLVGLWQLFVEAGGVRKGRELIPLCRDFIHDTEKWMTVGKMEFELAPKIEKLNQIKQMDKSGSLREIHAGLTKRILEIQNEIHEVTHLHGIHSRYVRSLKDFDDWQNRLAGASRKLKAQVLATVDFTLNEEVGDSIKRAQVSLAMIETALTEAEMQVGIVNDIAKALAEAKREKESLDLLEKILSPKDGLIAEQILVFINTFIGKINEVISRIWGYNLALDTCSIEDGEMTYDFPMYVHTQENRIPDIRFGSDSQLDIVNEAFILVVYKFMQLSGYPLYLDEFGRTFDEVHRHNLTLAIKDLIDDETFSQIFFITHSFESQNSYPNSQIAVLDESHVNLKRSFNEHVTIA